MTATQPVFRAQTKLLPTHAIHVLCALALAALACLSGCAKSTPSFPEMHQTAHSGASVEAETPATSGNAAARETQEAPAASSAAREPDAAGQAGASANSGSSGASSHPGGTSVLAGIAEMPLTDILASEDGAMPDPGLLAGIMGEEEAARLLEGAQSNRDLFWIAAHPDAFANDGDVVQRKVLRLAANEPEAVPYVRAWPDRFPQETGASGQAEGAPPEPTDPSGRIPRLYQWDPRWGYVLYSGSAFGMTGCGPTAFAMVYQGLTGNRNLSPYDMGVLAQQLGDEEEGTSVMFLYDGAEHLGLACAGIPVEEEALRWELDQGHIILANMDHGYFSQFDGHYLVITGYDANGLLTMNDPYSAVNSQRSWEIPFILNEAKGLYSYWIDQP